MCACTRVALACALALSRVLLTNGMRAQNIGCALVRRHVSKRFSSKLRNYVLIFLYLFFFREILIDTN